jgi:peptidyl-prolyl isomerase E (cyclophilin E)
MANANEKSVIYIGGLDDTITENILISAFIPFGEIKNVDIPLDHTTGIVNIILERHKGFAFIEYEDIEDCVHAIENMNDSELCSRVIRVNFAKPQRFREGYYKPIWMEEDYNKKQIGGDQKEFQ